MRFRLIPRDESFYPLFEDQADRIAATAVALQQLAGSLPVSDDGVRAILDAERAGDEVTDRIRHLLDTSIVTPFDREDIQALANNLDDVLDEMRAVADHLQLHNISAVVPGVNEQLVLLAKAGATCAELVRCLRTLRNVPAKAHEIERLESEADGMYRRVTAELFGGQHDALEILKWKDIVEAIESAIDAIEDASDVVQFIAVKHA
ncbi:MAG: DUF47 family protein [Ilumatobacteraceae bacterium]